MSVGLHSRLTLNLAIMGVHPVLDTNTSEVLTKRYPTGCDSLYAWFYDMFGVVRGFFYT